MKPNNLIITALVSAGLAFGVAGQAKAREHEEQTINSSDVPAAVQQAAQTEAKGGTIVRWEKEGVYRVTFPRNDVKVLVDGWSMPPFMGLGTWAAFTKGAHTEATVMGDTVLFEDEVNPAMSTALDNGLSVTALHNHFFFDRPKVYFMHIEGQGTTEELATAVRKIYDKIKEIRAANPQPKDSFGGTALPDKS